MGVQVIIRLTNERVCFNDTDCIPLERTNLPATHLTFREHRPIFWVLGMVGYDQATGKLQAFILSYWSQDEEKFRAQKPRKPIHELEFVRQRDMPGIFDWAELEQQLSSYRKGNFNDMLYNADHALSKAEEIDIAAMMHRPRFHHSGSKTEGPVLIPGKGEKYRIEKSFSISISECAFRFGYVEVSHFIPEVNEKVYFRIHNSHILPEFDLIKFWFSRVLGTKKIRVRASLEMIEGKILKREAHSKQIARIDDTLVETIKVRRTLNLTSLPPPDHGRKALFSPDELFALETSDMDTCNAFQQDGNDILGLLVEHLEIRNKQELIYLSGKVQPAAVPIKFTCSPYFGFLFFAQGEEHNHFIWELINSHATYIWSLEKSEKEVDEQFKRIEATMQTIISQGRERYKSAYKNNLIDQDILFDLIVHRYQHSVFLDAFTYWKKRLDEILS